MNLERALGRKIGARQRPRRLRDAESVLAEMAMTVIPETGPTIDDTLPASRPAEPPARPTIFPIVPAPSLAFPLS